MYDRGGADKRIHSTPETTLKILEDEMVRVQNEIEVNELIYSLHGCDSWQDMFKDNVPELEERCRGIQVAIDEIKQRERRGNGGGGRRRGRGRGNGGRGRGRGRGVP